MNNFNIDLWPDAFEDDEKNRSIEIIAEQARLLEKKTDNLVKARFIKSKSILSPLEEIIRAEKIFIVTEDEVDKKKDLNDAFQTIIYKFELFNDESKFRAFSFEYELMYPNKMFIDEGISSEVGYDKLHYIKSNDELIHTLKIILSSTKLRTVVSMLMKKPT